MQWGSASLPLLRAAVRSRTEAVDHASVPAPTAVGATALGTAAAVIRAIAITTSGTADAAV